MAALDGKALRLMRASKAPSTWKKYESEFAKFKNWASERKFAHLPASTRTTMRYLTFRAEGGSASALVTASAAISAFHKMNGFISPCADPRISAIIEGAKRSFSQPVAQKEPLTKEVLKAMWVEEIGEDYVGSLWQWRNCWILTLMFRTCARFADICKLKKSSFSFTEESLNMSVRIQQFLHCQREPT